MSKTKTPAQWVWGEDQQTAFETIRDKLISPPILAYADYSLPFIVHTDASSLGLGALLYQQQNGVKRVIAYASRCLRPSERNYPAHKLEFLALKWCVTDKFRDYLYGNEFVVKTNKNPLTYILTSAKLDATQHRWLAELSTFHFSLEYRAGKANADADGLSRRHVFQEELKAIYHAAIISAPVGNCVSDVAALHVASEEVLMSERVAQIDWRSIQASDGTIARIVDLLRSGFKQGGKELRSESADVRKFGRSKII